MAKKGLNWSAAAKSYVARIRKIPNFLYIPPILPAAAKKACNFVSKILCPMPKDIKVHPYLQYFKRTQILEDGEAAAHHGQLWT